MIRPLRVLVIRPLRGRASRPLGVLVMAVLALAGARTVAGATLTARAVDARGKPVASMRLVLLDLETVRMTTVETAVDGSLSVELGPGQYAVYVYRQGASTLLTEVVLKPTDERLLELRVDPSGDVSAQARERATAAVIHRGDDPSTEADTTLRDIQEYRIAGMDAGRSAAARTLAELVNPFTAKSGGRLHGSLYEFHRNDNLDARNFFDPVGAGLPEYKRNQFGATFGALVTPSLNLFGTYEGLRIIQGSTLLSHVPTHAMIQGDFGSLTAELRDPISGTPLEGGRIPASRIHPVARRLVELLPEPNRADPDRNFVNNEPVVRNRDTVTFRADYPFSPGSNFFARYLLSDGNNALVHPLPNFGSVQTERDQEIQLSLSQKVTSRLLASWRLNFARSYDFLGSVHAGQSGLLSSLGIAGVGVLDPSEEGYPDFRLSGYASFGDSQRPVTSTLNRFSFDGSAAYSAPNHTVRFGAGMTANQTNDQRSDGLRRGRFSFSGYYSGDAFADFLFGVPETATRGVGSDRADLRRKSWYVFARDQWKLGSRLSLSAGLNYNSYPPYRSVHDNVSGFAPLGVEPPLDGEIVIAGSARARQLGFERGLISADRNDWAPSVGIAYRPFGSNRLVVRGTFGISYTPLGGGYYASYLGRNTPFYSTQTAQSPVDRAALDLGSPFDTAVAAEVGVHGIEPRLRTGYVESWELQLAAAMWQHWSLEASYKGARGVRQPRVIYGNIPPPGAGAIQDRRPNPQFGRFTIVTGSGSYTRHALELGAERRLAQGVSLKAGFDWNRILDDLFRGYPSNARELGAERGPADFVPARQFTLNYIFDLPVGKNRRFLRGADGLAQAVLGGWRLSGITRTQDGYPYDVNLPGDANNDGLGDDRPDRIGSGRLPDGDRAIDRWFDTAHFAAPAPYAFGNSGRNIQVGPPFENWDLSLIKQTRFSDGQLVEFRVELFNAFNHVNFEQPYAVFGTSTFGKVFGARRAREIELALRYSF